MKLLRCDIAKGVFILHRIFSLPNALQEITSLAQWVCHKDKIPKNPRTGSNAKSNDPATWSDYSTALRTLQTGNYDGIGFQFGIYEAGTLRISGIDLDHVVRTDGTLESFALEIVEQMNSYTEYSPSGTGIHILCRVNLPAIGNKKGFDNGCAIEMYNHGRYFTVTGRVYGSERAIAERTNEYRKLHEKYFSEAPKAKNSPVIQPRIEEMSDRDLLDKMFNSQNGYAIQRLYSGDFSGYPSHSEADLALIAHLLFWTGGDEVRADRLFRESGLMRDKWDRADYRMKTLEYAIRNQVGVYEPRSNFPPVIEKNIATQKVQSASPEKSVSLSSSVKLSETNGQDISYYIQNGYNSDEKRFALYKDRKTGFENMDNLMKLYPGLYVLGAISSLGKTTFACQLADQLARAGEHVLYFSLEQSRYELVTKGLSRLTAQINMNHALSALEIREGKQSAELEQAKAEYIKFANHEVIYECGFDTTIETILNLVKNYIEDNKVRPVVIVDYLQIIRPIDSRVSTKDAVDSHVRAFKKLQVENDLVVLLISSLNRSNYLTPVDFEAFKESGGIEYTSDVLWGLQLSVMNDEIFDKDKGLKSKREKVREAKKATPRQVELVCLKNRYGVSSYTCKFNYYAQYDYFVAKDDSNEAGRLHREVLSF